MFWIYKCNAKKHPRQVVFGDWEDFFQSSKAQSWGSTEWVPPAFHKFPEPVPFTARCLAFPAAPVKLIALFHTVAALRAAVSVPGYIGRNTADGLERALADMGPDTIAEGPQRWFKDICHA